MWICMLCTCTESAEMEYKNGLLDCIISNIYILKH